MSRPANKSHMQQMKEDMLKERGGDPKKYGPGYQNPYNGNLKKHRVKLTKKHLTVTLKTKPNYVLSNY
jgi:hypothetical protein